MGGLPCAKAVIDNGYAVTQKLNCMSASIMLNASHTQPTDEQMDEFIARANHLAEYAAKVQEYVSRGSEEEYDKRDKDKDRRPGSGPGNGKLGRE